MKKAQSVIRNLVGMTGRILQHEIDHINGITFQKRANRFHLNQAQKERKYISRRRKNEAN